MNDDINFREGREHLDELLAHLSREIEHPSVRVHVEDIDRMEDARWLITGSV